MSTFFKIIYILNGVCYIDYCDYKHLKNLLVFIKSIIDVMIIFLEEFVL